MTRALAILLFAALPAFAGELVLEPAPESVRLERIVDGDTLAVWRERVSVRITGIDTPEIHGQCADEKAAAAKARDRLQAIVGAAKRVEIHECKPGADKFGRMLCRLSADGNDVGDQLVAEGIARAYDGKGRAGWCSNESNAGHAPAGR